jgi:homoserine dehydrogenase
VVTANKQVIADRGTQLHELAELSGVRLVYSAAVGGSVPMLEAVQQLAEEAEIRSLRGVLNGTTTFVLDEVAKGASFDEALASAQACGLAEADATLDLDGTDAAHKLVVLARTAFGVAIELTDVDRTGIQHLSADYVRETSQSGGVVRLVASIDFDGARVSARVAPSVLFEKQDAYLARTAGEQCCLVIRRQDAPEFVLHGKGAGRWPTTESVMGDLFSILRGAETAPPRAITEDFSYAGVAQ